jgi:hypothetical protein
LGARAVSVYDKAAQEDIFRRKQKHAIWLDPRYYETSDYRLTLFHEDQEAGPNQFTGEHPPLEKNITRRRWFLSMPGRTIQDVIAATVRETLIGSATEDGIIDSHEEDRDWV